MSKRKQVENAKARMVWSSDKGWHLPPSDPYISRHPREGGSNRLFKGSENEIVQTPMYGDDGGGGWNVQERTK